MQFMFRTRAKAFSLTIQFLSLLACRPVFAIGWTELIILVVIILILFGPFLLKVYRAIDKVRKIENGEDKNK